MRLRNVVALSVSLLLVGIGVVAQELENRLVIYSPHAEQGETLVKLFEATYPGIKVDYVFLGSQECLDRIRAEKARPQADLWWGAPTALFLQGKNEGLLEPYIPTFADKVPPAYKDRDNYFYGTFFTPVVLLWNRDAVSPDEAPKDWDDLLDEKWRGRIVIRYPLASGTMRTAYGFLIWRYYKDTGSPEAGYEWLLKLDANTVEYTAGSSLMYRALETGVGDVSIWNLPDTVDQIARGRPFDWTFPSSGTPVITDNIAIVADAPHPNAAKAFYEFVNTPLAQMFFAWRYARIPTRTDIAKDELPEWMRKDIPAAEVDWIVLSELGPQWMQYWDENIRGQGR